MPKVEANYDRWSDLVIAMKHAKYDDHRDIQVKQHIRSRRAKTVIEGLKLGYPPQAEDFVDIAWHLGTRNAKLANFQKLMKRVLEGQSCTSAQTEST